MYHEDPYGLWPFWGYLGPGTRPCCTCRKGLYELRDIHSKALLCVCYAVCFFGTAAEEGKGFTVHWAGSLCQRVLVSEAAAGS